MSQFLKNYLDHIRSTVGDGLARTAENTAKEFTSVCLDRFSYCSHEIGLLFGNVQAGKTAQMFGLICAAADASFPMIILLTTDSVALQSQTYDRVVSDLGGCGFCICSEPDKQKFVDNQLMKPAIIVLKKNSKVLLQWYNTLASTDFVRGNALLIVDDEADAASLNTLVNKKQQSTINERLSKIRNASVGSVYLQVTGTPQAILLQASNSAFRPSFVSYFKPGDTYLGGDFFFGGDPSHVSFIDKHSGERDGLYYAVIHHLTASAQTLLQGGAVCNFVIHPGSTKASHNGARSRVEMILNKLKAAAHSAEFEEDIKACWSEMTPKGEKQSLDSILAECRDLLNNNEISLYVMNADHDVRDTDYRTGSNIIVGGNILGRGVTFPKLQTIYYTRTAKKPQADTMWQHSRMFGYDRDPGMMKLFLTKELYKIFSDLNAGNNSIIAQTEGDYRRIQLIYPEGISPTRKNVMDLRMVDIAAGGTNYYPADPDNIDKPVLDEMLSSFSDTGSSQVSLQIILKILSHIEPSEDFSLKAFTQAVKAILSQSPLEQGVLIVRRGREVTQGTGSLLSPNDRQLGDSFSGKVVLTMYQIAGEHGWKRPDIWVPNIRLPEYFNFYSAD